MTTRQEALKILEAEGADEGVLNHSKAVAREAVRIARIITDRGTDVDVEFIEAASLLHDIGRAHSHGIDHGVIGSSLLRAKGLTKAANVAERHIGAGITAKEASALGLPERDMVPRTLEEKIIAYADNLFVDDEMVSPEESLSRFERKLGKGSAPAKRMRQLNREISELM